MNAVNRTSGTSATVMPISPNQDRLLHIHVIKAAIKGNALRRATADQVRQIRTAMTATTPPAQTFKVNKKFEGLHLNGHLFALEVATGRWFSAGHLID